MSERYIVVPRLVILEALKHKVAIFVEGKVMWNGAILIEKEKQERLNEFRRNEQRRIDRICNGGDN